MAVNKVVYDGRTLIDLTADTVAPSTLVKGTTAHDMGGNEIVGTLEATAVAQATPSITVSTGGLITAKSTQSAGLVPSGTKQATKQLTTQGAKTVTPTKSNQTAVSSGVYTTGAVTVAPIPDTYIRPSGTLEVTENGTHDVTSYESVNVNVPSSVDTCTVQISIYNTEDVDVQNAAKVTYVNGENECTAVALTLDDWTDRGGYWSISLTVVKGTFIYTRLGGISVMSGKAQRLDSYTILINGNASLYYS